MATSNTTKKTSSESAETKLDPIVKVEEKNAAKVKTKPTPKPKPAPVKTNSEEPKTVKESLGQYYKNVSPYIHYVNDLSLMFYPNECKDLSLEQAKTLNNSADLKKSIRLGIINQLTKSEFEREQKSVYIRT